MAIMFNGWFVEDIRVGDKSIGEIYNNERLIYKYSFDGVVFKKGICKPEITEEWTFTLETDIRLFVLYENEDDESVKVKVTNKFGRAYYKDVKQDTDIQFFKGETISFFSKDKQSNITVYIGFQSEKK